MARTLGTIASVAALVALAACTSTPDDEAPSTTGTPSEPAASSAPSATPSDPTTASPVGSEAETVTLTVAQGADADGAQGRTLHIPRGWEAEVWASVPRARIPAWAPDGRLLVATGDAGTVVALTPTGDGTTPDQTVLLDGLNNPQGLDFADDRTLVVAEADALRSYVYVDGAVTAPSTLIEGLPSSGHGSKAVVVDGERIVFSLGSESNRSPSDRTGSPERAVIAAVPLDGGPMTTVATGVRNGFGLDLAPDGSLWTAVNQADNQPYPFDDDAGRPGDEVREYVNDNPIEQLTRIDDGAELGWPYCVPDTREVNIDVPFINDPENNPGGEALDCGALPPTRIGLPAHSAPLGLTFTHDTEAATTLGDGAIVTMHGSWNRQPPREPALAFAPWDGDTLAAPTPLVTGFQTDDGSRWGRPVATAVGPDGDLYVTDDEAGLVYRIGPSD